MHVRLTSLEKLEAALTSVSWETATRRGPVTVALDSAWGVTASLAKVSMGLFFVTRMNAITNPSAQRRVFIVSQPIIEG